MLKNIFICLSTLISILSFLLSACSGAVAAFQVTAAPLVPATPMATLASPTLAPPTRAPSKLWISPAIPDKLRMTAKGWNMPLSDSKESATMRLESASVNGPSASVWVYALVVAFPTVRDGSAWRS
jgi:hypothetical protein